MRIVTLAGNRWAPNCYMTLVTESSDQLKRRCWNENLVPAEAGPPGPRLSSPGEQERNTVIARRVGGSICCSSVQSPTHLSHTILSIKWVVYFSKELCPLVVKFLHASAYEYTTVCRPLQFSQKCPYLEHLKYLKVVMLYFDLRPGPKCHSRWCTGRKWHILMAVMRGNRVGGN